MAVPLLHTTCLIELQVLLLYLSTSSGRRGRLIGSLGYILADLGRRIGPKGDKMAAACPGVESQDLATILDPLLRLQPLGRE